MRAINDQVAATGVEPFAAVIRSAEGAGLADAELAALRPGGARHASGGDAMIDHAVMVAVNRGCRHAVAIHLRDLVARHRAMVQAMAGEVRRRHKGERIDAEPKSEAAVDALAVVGQADPGREAGGGWQRRPAAIVPAVSPAHPGRSPHVARRPAPAPVRMTEPPAVVERRPAPGVTRHPVPPAIGIEPPPAVAIGPPGGIDHDHRRLPAKAVAVHINPRAIRRERIVEHRVIAGCRCDVGLCRVLRLRGHFRRGQGCGFGFGRSGCWRRRRGGGRGGAGGDRAQGLVALDHGGDDRAGDADVIQVDDVFGAETERAGGVGDKSQHHRFVEARVRELGDFGCRPGEP